MCRMWNALEKDKKLLPKNCTISLSCILKLPTESAALPGKMCVKAASSLCSPVPASSPACKAPAGFPRVSGSSGDLMAIKAGFLWEELGAVWFERELTLKGVSGHGWGGKPCYRESLSSLASLGSRHLLWEVSAITEFLWSCSALLMTNIGWHPGFRYLFLVS